MGHQPASQPSSYWGVYGKTGLPLNHAWFSGISPNKNHPAIGKPPTGIHNGTPHGPPIGERCLFSFLLRLTRLSEHLLSPGQSHVYCENQSKLSTAPGKKKYGKPYENHRKPIHNHTKPRKPSEHPPNSKLLPGRLSPPRPPETLQHPRRSGRSW